MSISERTAATAVPMVVRVASKGTGPATFLKLGATSIRYSTAPREFCKHRNIGTLRFARALELATIPAEKKRNDGRSDMNPGLSRSVVETDRHLLERRTRSRMPPTRVCQPWKMVG